MPWEDLDCDTYSKSPGTQQLTVIQQWKERLATVVDGKLPTNQKIEGYERHFYCVESFFNTGSSKKMDGI
jgi:hypothetical protein